MRPRAFTPPVRKINSVLDARRAGNRGKSKRRLKTIWVNAPNTNSEIGHNSPRARPRAQTSELGSMIRLILRQLDSGSVEQVLRRHAAIRLGVRRNTSARD